MQGELPAAAVSEAEEYTDMDAAASAEWRRSEPLASRGGEGGSIKMTSMQVKKLGLIVYFHPVKRRRT
jgi:hypothetical protein